MTASPRISHLASARAAAIAKDIATSWNGGTPPAPVASSASADHSTIAMAPIRVARPAPPRAGGDTAADPTAKTARLRSERGRPRSIHMLAAVDRQRRAGDEAGLVGDEEEHAASDLLGMAKPPDGDARDDLLEHVGRHGAHHLGVDVARRDGVDGDPLAGAFLRQRLGEAVDARLGGGIIHLAVLS